MALTEEIDLGKIDDFVAVPAENRFEHKEAETDRLIEADRQWHREFLPVDEDFDQSGPVMLECLCDHRSNLIRRFRSQPEEAGCLGHLCKIRIMQVCGKFQDAGRLHFQFDERQGIVLEDNNLDRQPHLPERQQIAHEHRETTVSRQRDDLSTRMAGIRAYGLRKGVRH